ncbi:MAG: ABC transporter permease subunit [Acidimicrobiia bacterium]|nr:ABC transporter permease subunit [Acidimicrobiia bacterium]
MALATDTDRTARPPFWRDVKVLRVVAQVVVGVGAVLLFLFLGRNLNTNLTAANIPTDFEFLKQPAGVAVTGSDFRPSQPISDIILLGIKNTAALAVVGIPLLTILGTLVGIGRLSSNWLVRKSATVYVETLRNIPPLLVIIFTNAAVILSLPRIQDAITPGDLFVISNRFLAIPWANAGENSGVYLAVLGVGILVSIVVWIWRTRKFDATGTPHHRFLWGTGVFLLFAIIGFYAVGKPYSLSRPVVVDGRIIEGGYQTVGPYIAVLLALVIYTASHVAEIVRGSIQAVAKGQTEAANALALSSFQRLRFVVLPQAFRIAIPPLINQFLNFTKNTSLAIAIGYAEVTLVVFQAIGNAKPAPQLILILMGAYLLFSLTISLLINFLNRRLQLVTN